MRQKKKEWERNLKRYAACVCSCSCLFILLGLQLDVRYEHPTEYPFFGPLPEPDPEQAAMERCSCSLGKVCDNWSRCFSIKEKHFCKILAKMAIRALCSMQCLQIFVNHELEKI